MSILDHLTLNVRDYARSKAFYTQALAPLGITLVMEYGEACGFGRGPKPDLWISARPASFQTAEQMAVITPIHLAFAARSRDEVLDARWRCVASPKADRAQRALA